MIVAKSLAEARRTHVVHPDGRETWVSWLFTASAQQPDAPVAFFVEKEAHAIIPPHFHEVNQFQVLVEGQAILGKQEVQPLTAHYTNGFTGYGPLCAAAEGMAFFTLRNRFDAGGARYFPAGRSFMRPTPKRHRISAQLVSSTAAALHSLSSVGCDTVFAPEADGLASWFLRVGPGMLTHAPDPAAGGGQYIVVTGGTLVYHHRVFPRLSCLYVSRDAGPFALQAGAEGLEALMVQFPVAEAAPSRPRKK
jgi:hypothetical protein